MREEGKQFACIHHSLSYTGVKTKSAAGLRASARLARLRAKASEFRLLLVWWLLAGLQHGCHARRWPDSPGHHCSIRPRRLGLEAVRAAARPVTRSGAQNASTEAGQTLPGQSKT